VSDRSTEIRSPLAEVVVDVDGGNSRGRRTPLEGSKRAAIGSACATSPCDPSNARSLMTSISSSAVPLTGNVTSFPLRLDTAALGEHAACQR